MSASWRRSTTCIARRSPGTSRVRARHQELNLPPPGGTWFPGAVDRLARRGAPGGRDRAGRRRHHHDAGGPARRHRLPDLPAPPGGPVARSSCSAAHRGASSKDNSRPRACPGYRWLRYWRGPGLSVYRTRDLLCRSDRHDQLMYKSSSLLYNSCHDDYDHQRRAPEPARRGG